MSVRSLRPRPERYSKAEDAPLLPLIVEILGGRQTYGYRRIQRLLNRQPEGGRVHDVHSGKGSVTVATTSAS